MAAIVFLLTDQHQRLSYILRQQKYNILRLPPFALVENAEAHSRFRRRSSRLKSESFVEFLINTFIMRTIEWYDEASFIDRHTVKYIQENCAIESTAFLGFAVPFGINSVWPEQKGQKRKKEGDTKEKKTVR